MTLTHLLHIVYSRRRLALLVLCCIVAVVATVSGLQPKQYLASAAVLVDSKSTDPVAPPGTGGVTNISSYMATQIDLIQSERVAVRALHAMKLDSDADWRALWMKATHGNGSSDAWIAEQLLKKLEVKPSRDSSIVNIGFLSTDPVFAATVANAFVRSYIDTTLELKVEPARQYSAFFDERARQLRAALEQAQARLSAYQQAKGIVATDERLDVENARLAELSSQVVLLQGVAAESAGRQGAAGANTQEVLSNVMIGSMTNDLSRQEARLSELRQRLGERNPQVVELIANIDQLRSRLAAETRRVSSSLGVNNSVDRSRVAQSQAALNEQRAKVLRLRGQRDEASVLVRDVDSAQRSYDAALTRVTQTTLESQNTFTNVSVVKTATPPPVATSPRVLLNTAVAIVVGGLLAIGLALLRESADRRLRFDTDVTDLLRLPMLTRVPSSGRQDARLEVRKSRMVHGLPHVAP